MPLGIVGDRLLLRSGWEDLMKIVCKMTTVLACCQTNRQNDREGGREGGERGE